MATTPKALTQALRDVAAAPSYTHLRWPFFVGFLVLPIKELDVLGDHLGAIVLYLALIFPRAIMKPPFNVDHLPLRKLLVTDLGQFIPRNDGMPGRLFVVSSALIFPAAVGCHGKGRHGCALWGIVHLRVTAEPSDERNLIHHRECLLFVLRRNHWSARSLRWRGALLVVDSDKAVCMSTVALKHCRELCLIRQGAAEAPILTTFQR